MIRSFRPSLFIVVETHCPFDTVASFWRRAGYDLCGCSEASGHRGGIWILAPANRSFDVRVVEVHFQAVTISISVNNRAWTCSAIYASPNPSLREDFWRYLIDLRQRILEPWLAVGDFNEIISPSEVSGGAFCQNRANRMLSMLEACEFLDLGSTGKQFTWERRPHGGRTIAKRLDRAVGDIAWRHTFPEAYVEHLARVSSEIGRAHV